MCAEAIVNGLRSQDHKNCELLVANKMPVLIDVMNKLLNERCHRLEESSFYAFKCLLISRVKAFGKEQFMRCVLSLGSAMSTLSLAVVLYMASAEDAAWESICKRILSHTDHKGDECDNLMEWVLADRPRSFGAFHVAMETFSNGKLSLPTREYA